jgi:hypothetical protein
MGSQKVMGELGLSGATVEEREKGAPNGTQQVFINCLRRRGRAFKSSASFREQGLKTTLRVADCHWPPILEGQGEACRVRG